MQIHLSALGCRLNEAELELWASEFRAKGHHLVTEAADADVMVLNTCAVTQEAVRKSRKSITALQRHNPSAKMVVSGCFVSLDQHPSNEQLAHSLGVDLIVDNRHKDRLVEHAHEALQLDTMSQAATAPDANTLFKRNRHRAFIKIQDGCRYRCTFCIVTKARGEERSRSLQEIVSEVNTLVQEGVQEIVLTGVHVGGYGSDIESTLKTLVETLLRETDIPRIRFASVEPWDLPEDFVDLFENSRLMPHMHLPLQSGSDTVLRRMARRCKTADFKRLVTHLRDAIPDFNVTTDIIVGFPGETEQEWQESLDFIQETGFGHMHIFSYSVREGTKAAGLPGQLPGNIKKGRSKKLHEIAATLKRDFYSLYDKRSMPVLWEGGRTDPETGNTTYHGYTPNYLRVSCQQDATALENTICQTQLSLAPQRPELTGNPSI